MPAGGSDHDSGGEVSSPSQVYLVGILPPCSNAGLLKPSGDGVGGRGVSVGAGVFVAGIGVSVGGMGVAVGGGVFVKADSGVFVDRIGVIVGVSDDGSADVQPIIKNKVIVKVSSICM